MILLIRNYPWDYLLLRVRSTDWLKPHWELYWGSDIARSSICQTFLNFVLIICLCIVPEFCVLNWLMSSSLIVSTRILTKLLQNTHMYTLWRMSKIKDKLDMNLGTTLKKVWHLLFLATKGAKMCKCLFHFIFVNMHAAIHVDSWMSNLNSRKSQRAITKAFHY